jgi:hypothetical protein
MRRLSIRLVIASITFLFGVGILIESHGQNRRETTMNRTELAQAAAVLKALAEGWALIDYNPDIDFLVFVGESRDELDFYPKKSFVRMMERSGLIENRDKEVSTARQPHTYYERGRPSVWKEVTEAGLIVFQYDVTPKGQELLRDAPRLIGTPVRALRPATSPIDTQIKPLRVVTYNRRQIQKLVHAFDQKATTLIAKAFSPRNDLDRAASANRGLVCGPKLWRTLEPNARRNGLQPKGSLLSVTYDLANNGAWKESASKLEDQLILPSDEARLFWKTLSEAFRIDGRLAIRRATRAERSAYKHQEEFADTDFPSPDLADLTILFIVEGNNSKFMVVVKNVPDDKMEHYQPEVTWVEIMLKN